MKNHHPEIEDHELIAGFVRNDSRCVARIYQENYNSVLQYVLKNNGREADAKDIYQEAVVATWLNIKEGKYEVKTGKSIGGYIFQIARFKWLDKLKSKEYKSKVRLVHSNYTHDDEPVEYIEEDERRMQHLQTLYKKLNDKCKAILTRYYYQKKSLTEIGDELKYDAGTVKTLKYRCMKKLRDLHNEIPLTDERE